MTKYRAIVSISFTDEDLQEFADDHDIDLDRIDPLDFVNGELDALERLTGWVEQFFVNKRPTIAHRSNGITVEVADHD